jgi:hypothetical protein
MREAKGLTMRGAKGLAMRVAKGLAMRVAKGLAMRGATGLAMRGATEVKEEVKEEVNERKGHVWIRKGHDVTRKCSCATSGQSPTRTGKVCGASPTAYQTPTTKLFSAASLATASSTPS